MTIIDAITIVLKSNNGRGVCIACIARGTSAHIEDEPERCTLVITVWCKLNASVTHDCIERITRIHNATV